MKANLETVTWTS
jgi:hypothetical protein